MRSLPLFHRIAGRPVVVLGEGPLAEPKRRLVERAGGVVVSDIADGVARGARLAFIALDDAAGEGNSEAVAAHARSAGLLVNVVDRPNLCDFTTPSLLERDPVLVAIGTDGASAGLAKQLRLRLETLLPADLGALALRLAQMRDAIRSRWPDAKGRRRVLDAALGQGGPLDPLTQGAADRVEAWLGGQQTADPAGVHEFVFTGLDPDDLTLRQARLLGSADAVLFDPAITPALLDRVRADAVRKPLPHVGTMPDGLVVIVRKA